MFNWFTVRKLRRLKEKQVSDVVLKKHRRELLAFMENNPMRIAPGRPFFAISHAWKPMMAGLLGFAVLSGTGGAVYAAQASLPGEALYAVKIASEDVREHFVLSPEKKMHFKAVRAERRLAEVEILLKRGNFPEKRPERVHFAMQKYEDQIEKMENLAGHLAEKRDDEANERVLMVIDRMVDKHDRVIESASTSDEASEERVFRHVERSLDLEERFMRSLDKKRESFEEKDDDQRQEIRKKMDRIREDYKSYQEKRRTDDEGRD